MPTVQLKNYTCNYEFLNSGKDRTIIFSNSLGTDYSMWNKVVDIIKSDFNIILHDTRGHGKSTNSQKELTIEELGEDIIELLHTLKIEGKITFCGLSMGGLIGQYLGINHSHIFDKIILANTASKIGSTDSWNTRIETVMANGLSSILTGTAERWFTPNFQANHADEVNAILEKFAANDLAGYCASCAAVRDGDYRYQIDKINIPVLVITGSEDLVTTVDDGRFMKTKITVSKLEVLEAAHLSAVEQAEEFAKNILSF
ncbi:3-oxoadipate enol-lactonase [Chryseobacterium sp.]|uniref:3-oxoadipate enol-lactonase n=1 Tax=Chryseobacterium sp. TaxID=1871047 RepID=UPI0025BD0AFD|nr:3-oxoadipate enol-lactonase [Chryseobacterium sp.]